MAFKLGRGGKFPCVLAITGSFNNEIINFSQQIVMHVTWFWSKKLEPSYSRENTLSEQIYITVVVHFRRTTRKYGRWMIHIIVFQSSPGP